MQRRLGLPCASPARSKDIDTAKAQGSDSLARERLDRLLRCGSYRMDISILRSSIGSTAAAPRHRISGYRPQHGRTSQLQVQLLQFSYTHLCRTRNRHFHAWCRLGGLDVYMGQSCPAVCCQPARRDRAVSLRLPLVLHRTTSRSTQSDRPRTRSWRSFRQHPV